jgi:probable rRNA maturation factor
MASMEIGNSDLEKIEKAFDGSFTPSKVYKKSCNLIVVSAKKMVELNKELFNSFLYTDVVSINSPTSNNQYPTTNLGDIYICPEVIFENAKKYDVSYNEELTRVIIHGILHLIGYDHHKPFGKSREKMFKVQEELLDKIKTT